MIKEGVFLGKRYEILGRIGSGGMADVYKGKDHKLNRFVAIKVLKSDISFGSGVYPEVFERGTGSGRIDASKRGQCL